MDSSFQFTCGDDDTDRLSEEEFSGVASSSGEDEDPSFENDSEGGVTTKEVHENGFGADPVPSDGDALGFRSAEDFVDQVWKVRRIDDSHNHPLAATMFNHLLPSHQNLSESDKAQVDYLKKFGIATSKILAYMIGQSGGYGMLWFTKRNLYNYVHSQRLAQINDGDAAATISYLEGKANADMMSVARYTKTLEGRLGSLF
ncbi:hypothetical protein AHAS_Ahas03G0120000 [Arachis hypogaea]